MFDVELLVGAAPTDLVYALLVPLTVLLDLLLLELWAHFQVLLELPSHDEGVPFVWAWHSISVGLVMYATVLCSLCYLELAVAVFPFDVVLAVWL